MEFSHHILFPWILRELWSEYCIVKCKKNQNNKCIMTTFTNVRRSIIRLELFTNYTWQNVNSQFVLWQYDAGPSFLARSPQFISTRGLPCKILLLLTLTIPHEYPLIFFFSLQGRVELFFRFSLLPVHNVVSRFPFLNNLFSRLNL